MHFYLIKLGRINLNIHPQIHVQDIGTELATYTNGFFYTLPLLPNPKETLFPNKTSSIKF